MEWRTLCEYYLSAFFYAVLVIVVIVARERIGTTYAMAQATE